LANDIDADGDILTVSNHTNPSNGTLVMNSNGSFSYTPNSGFTGSDSFTYNAFDGTDESNSATVIINVTVNSTTPVAVNDSYALIQDSVLTVSAENGVLANDLNTDGLTVSVKTNPLNGTLILNEDGSFTYTPNADFIDVDTFEYKINDSDISALVSIVVQTLNITYGSILHFLAEDIPDFEGTLIKAPKLYGIIEGGKKGAFKKIKSSTAEDFSGAWGKIFRLYDKKVLKATSYELTEPMKSKKIQVFIKGKTIDKQKVDKQICTAFLAPPVIDEILDASGNIAENFKAGSIIAITGKYFGIKPPKVSLLVNGKLLKCKVDKVSLKFTDFKGKPSSMDGNNGESFMRVILPAAEKLPGGTYSLILDNKIGVATKLSDGKTPTINID
jgi:hypothetical protein